MSHKLFIAALFAPASAEGRRSVTLTSEFTSMAKSHGTYAPEELTPVFTPPYKVEVFLSDTAVRQGSKRKGEE